MVRTLMIVVVKKIALLNYDEIFSIKKHKIGNPVLPVVDLIYRHTSQLAI